MDMEFLDFEGIPYVVKYPNGYKAGEKYPVIIFLHGAGTRGNDFDILLNNPYFKIVYTHSDFPFITVAPQCAENSWFDVFERLKRLVIRTASADYTDKERIYLMGASMGGYGTWQLATSMPEMFAAVVPISGGGVCYNAFRLKKLPVWAFHCANDPVVDVGESVRMVNAVNSEGGNAKITIYADNRYEDKHDAWSDTYGNYKVFKWMLSNRNTEISSLEDKLKGSEIYG